ncbi:MAG: hypothetical protein MK212_20260 [Saprospiraceae bacterium]|nr:hypothetical protein [Saprospiraceae bacterium]
MHKNYLFVVLFVLLGIIDGVAQKKQATKASPFELGLQIPISYNLYHRYQGPTYLGTSGNTLQERAGQLLNILPGLGAGIWLGQPRYYTISLDAQIEYKPFSLRMGEFRGLGAYAIPILMRVQVPFWRTKGLALVGQLGGGVQLSQMNLYARPSNVDQLSLSSTIVGEFAVGVLVGWDGGQPAWQLDVFTRIGRGRDRATSTNIGLRLTALIRIIKGSYISTIN